MSDPVKTSYHINFDILTDPVKMSYHINFDILTDIIITIDKIEYKIPIDQSFINKTRSVLEQLGAVLVR